MGEEMYCEELTPDYGGWQVRLEGAVEPGTDDISV